MFRRIGSLGQLELLEEHESSDLEKSTNMHTHKQNCKRSVVCLGPPCRAVWAFKAYPVRRYDSRNHPLHDGEPLKGTRLWITVTSWRGCEAVRPTTIHNTLHSEAFCTRLQSNYCKAEPKTLTRAVIDLVCTGICFRILNNLLGLVLAGPDRNCAPPLICKKKGIALVAGAVVDAVPASGGFLVLACH